MGSERAVRQAAWANAHETTSAHGGIGRHHGTPAPTASHDSRPYLLSHPLALQQGSRGARLIHHGCSGKGQSYPPLVPQDHRPVLLRFRGAAHGLHTPSSPSRCRPSRCELPAPGPRLKGHGSEPPGNIFGHMEIATILTSLGRRGRTITRAFRPCYCVQRRRQPRVISWGFPPWGYSNATAPGNRTTAPRNLSLTSSHSYREG